MSDDAWTVFFHAEAVVEFAALKDRRQRQGVLTIAAILQRIGPKLVEPHAKPVKGASGLRELRPSGGRVLVRPLYVRFGERMFVVLAIAPEAVADPRGFSSAVARARARARRDLQLDI